MVPGAKRPCQTAVPDVVSRGPEPDVLDRDDESLSRVSSLDPELEIEEPQAGQNRLSFATVAPHEGQVTGRFYIGAPGAQSACRMRSAITSAPSVRAGGGAGVDRMRSIAAHQRPASKSS